MRRGVGPPRSGEFGLSPSVDQTGAGWALPNLAHIVPRLGRWQATRTAECLDGQGSTYRPWRLLSLGNLGGVLAILHSYLKIGFRFLEDLWVLQQVHCGPTMVLAG